MKILDIINESLDGYELKEKVFDYLLNMARAGGQYKDEQDRRWIESKLDSEGNYLFHQHALGNHPERDVDYICTFDDIGMVTIVKRSNGKEVLMFHRS